jgi:hypothetical protein
MALAALTVHNRYRQFEFTSLRQTGMTLFGRSWRAPRPECRNGFMSKRIDFEFCARHDSAFFPPAVMGVMALSKAGDAHEMIIAVDGKRTCDVIDFEEALEKAEAGEVVYLTVVRHDRREQIRLALPVQ